jgi:antitoxin HicB
MRLFEAADAKWGARMKDQLHYTAIFEPAEEGGYIVTFPAIPGLATQGETLDEARAMAADCLGAYLESLQKDGEPMPYEAPEGPITERLTVELASA